MTVTECDCDCSLRARASGLGLDAIVGSALEEWFQQLLRGMIGEARAGGRGEDAVDLTDALGSLHHGSGMMETGARLPGDATRK